MLHAPTAQSRSHIGVMKSQPMSVYDPSEPKVPDRLMAGLGAARAEAGNSKDPSTQTGVAVLDGDGGLLAVGRNRFPPGVPETPENFADREFKLANIVHAEIDAIRRAEGDLDGAVAFVWPWPPCAECTEALVKAGVEAIYAPAAFGERLDRWRASFERARQVARQRGVRFEELDVDPDDVDAKQFDLTWSQAIGRP